MRGLGVSAPENVIIVLERLQVERRPPLGTVTVSGPFERDADDVDGCNHPPSAAPPLEAERLHLRRDVALREPVAARGGPAALEQVVGEEADVRAQERGRDRRGGRLLGGVRVTGDGGCGGDGEGGGASAGRGEQGETMDSALRAGSHGKGPEYPAGW